MRDGRQSTSKSKAVQVEARAAFLGDCMSGGSQSERAPMTRTTSSLTARSARPHFASIAPWRDRRVWSCDRGVVVHQPWANERTPLSRGAGDVAEKALGFAVPVADC